MPEKKLPADWMIKRALEVTGSTSTIDAVKSYRSAYDYIINVAHYIGEHESEPVDPDLLIAREAVKMASPYANAIIGDGPNCYTDIALRAIKLARERGAL